MTSPITVETAAARDTIRPSVSIALAPDVSHASSVTETTPRASR